MKDIITKNFYSFINNNILLAQLFIGILFFESYFIGVNNESLLNLPIKYDSITLKPFFYFLVFIAVSKAIWLVIYSIKIHFPIIRESEREISFNYKIQITAFLLLIVNCVYTSLVFKNPKMSPFYYENFTTINNLYIALLFFVCFGCLFIVIVSKVKTENK